jgi:DNA-binding CsgD family transcriptional regulator
VTLASRRPGFSQAFGSPVQLLRGGGDGRTVGRALPLFRVLEETAVGEARRDTADDRAELVTWVDAMRSAEVSSWALGESSVAIAECGRPNISGLTPRQAEVAQRAIRGESNGAIAAALRVSPRTIANTMQKIFRTLRVGSRAELARVSVLDSLPIESSAAVPH